MKRIQSLKLVLVVYFLINILLSYINSVISWCFYDVPHAINCSPIYSINDRININELVFTLILLLFIIVVFIAFAFLIFGILKWLTSFKNPSTKRSAVRLISVSVIWIIVASVTFIVSFFIVSSIFSPPPLIHQ